MKDSIKMQYANSECYDKMQIALTIQNSTFSGEFGYFVLRQGILKSCDSCELKNMWVHWLCSRKIYEGHNDNATRI